VLHPGNDPHCWRRQETMKILADWSKQTDHITIYDYNPGLLTGLFVPERDVANFTANAPQYKALGIKGFVTEGRKSFMNAWISYYIRGKLMWDAHADVAALKKDFYNTFFGPEAGPQVQAWWDACEDALGKATIHPHEDFLVNQVYTVTYSAGGLAGIFTGPLMGWLTDRVGAAVSMAVPLTAYVLVILLMTWYGLAGGARRAVPEKA
jgi:hypothetical protein